MPLYNIPYSPATNPVEACFSVVKSHFKRKRMECLVNDKEFDPIKHINEAFEQVKPEHVKNCARRSMTILTETNFIYM